MKKDNDKNSNAKAQQSDADYNPANRDFQRTEEDLDNVSKSEKEELEKRKQRIHEARSTPDKNHVG